MRSTISGSRSKGPERRDGGAGRLNEMGLEPPQEQTTCCYAVQDKVWVTDPDGAPWEVYAVLADALGRHGPGRRRRLFRVRGRRQ